MIEWCEIKSFVIKQTKQNKLIFNFFVNRNWKKLIDSRKRAKILADNRNREGLGEFETVRQTRDEVEGLHNCLEFSPPLSCLYQAMQTLKTFSIA